MCLVSLSEDYIYFFVGNQILYIKILKQPIICIFLVE